MNNHIHELYVNTKSSALSLNSSYLKLIINTNSLEEFVCLFVFCERLNGLRNS